MKDNIQQSLGVFDTMPEIIGMEFKLEGKSFQIADPADERDLLNPNPPIGVQLAGGQGQFLAVRKDGRPFHVQLYWYRQFEGTFRLVLDSIREA
ncbi:MAG TPA: hypothetical protein VFF14_01400 [Candidatus Deferrimicrobium sp.]|nr:hypothetical protein [Candidatus Deferrimicrobium sp.]